MIFDKHRFEVWTQAQHPYRHTLSDFAYSNPALPGVTEVQATLNWIIKVLYPLSKASVATPADLPAIGNTLNDYRVVLDDGDGKSAGYRWEQREGDVSPSWYKVFDFDWSTDSILAAFQNITQDLYVYQQGKSDLDGSGNPIAGLYAGQKVYGGNLANQNLTLAANSGDGVGAHTGFVQVDDNFRPTLNNTYDSATTALKWKTGYFGTSAIISTLTLSTGSIVDSGASISFGSNNLITTGNFTGVIGYFTTRVEVGPLAGNALLLAAGSITDESGAISFGSTNLTTSGTLTAATGSKLADITFANGSITSLTATITFSANNLSTSGTGNFGNTQVTRLDADNIRLDANTISVTNANGNLILIANGSGIIDLQSAVTSLGIAATGNISATGYIQGGNLRATSNTISSQNTNGNIQLSPNGTGIVESTASIKPSSDNTLDLGDSTHRFRDVYIGSDIKDGTNTFTIANLMTFKNANVGVSTGMTLFYNSVSGFWEPSIPDTEITHSSLSGLTTGDAGHTQFVMLAGRSGGQSIQGGTAASENLNLESTAHATKGSIFVKDHTKPFTNASYSAGWQGIDLGGSSNYFRDIYTKGELRGFRFENFTSGTLPAASANNIGHAVWTTDDKNIWVDTGGAWVALGVNKFSSDTSWDGSTTTKDVTVSSTITDARLALWGLHDNSNDFERIYTSIKAISASVVRITVSPALPAGSYRLIGIE